VGGRLVEDHDRAVEQERPRPRPRAVADRR
jgi:hypothetical protein